VNISYGRSVRTSYGSARDACRAVIAPFLVSRAGVLAVGVIAAFTIGYDPPPNESAVWRIAADPLRNLLARWDTFWYLDIATRGYRWNGNVLQQQNIVFFPLYPMLMRLGGLSIGGHPIAAGLFVSLAAFFCALVYFWRLVAEELDEATASRATMLLCAFPFAVYFSAVYTESLFLLAIVGAFFHLRRREFARAACWGLAAGFVRPNGFLLAAPAAWFAITMPPISSRPARAAAVVAPLAGAVCYSAYLRFAVGQPFAWITDQAAWPTIAPWAASTAAYAPGPIPLRDILIHAGNAASLALAVASLWPVTRLLGAGYSLFVALNIAPAVARHGLLSLGRFTSVMFPIFIWLARRTGPRHRRLMLIGFAAAQALAAALFFTWRPLV
jgi:hypothetical protein